MSELPASWIKATVGDLFQTVGGGTPSTAIEEFWQGTIPWISSADIDNAHHMSISRFISKDAISESATNMVPAGSVIVVTRVGLGKVSVAGTALCFSQDHQALLIDQEHFDTKYVLYFMSQAVTAFKHISRGTTISGVTKRQLLQTGFILPPRPEQNRIVAEIEKQFTRLDAATTALKRVQANLKRYRASVLKAACEGRLAPTEAELARKEGRDYEPADKLLQRILRERRARWEADTLAKMQASGKPPKDDSWKQKYKEPLVPDTTTLPTLPEGWCWAALGQLTEIQGGIQKQPSRAPRSNSFPFLRVANVLRGKLDLSEIHQIELFGGELARFRLEQGDLLIVEGNGSPSEIGRMALWLGEIQNCVHQNHIIRARPLPGVSSDYLMQFWNSPTGADQVLAVASSTTGLHTLSVGKVSGLAVPLPPESEQKRIADATSVVLHALTRSEEVMKVQQMRSTSFRQSILRSAFTGQLVPQDPTDEPASALLDRIRAERASQSKAKPRSRLEGFAHV